MAEVQKDSKQVSDELKARLAKAAAALAEKAKGRRAASLEKQKKEAQAKRKEDAQAIADAVKAVLGASK